MEHECCFILIKCPWFLVLVKVVAERVSSEGARGLEDSASSQLFAFLNAFVIDFERDSGVCDRFVFIAVEWTCEKCMGGRKDR